MVRQIFKGKVIAAAGPLPDQLTPQNLQQWTKVRKGTFSHEIDETVTHLLCTREQFNKKVGRVKLALKRNKRLHIVHYDWFEFSTVAEKRLPEREFSMRNFQAKQRAKERERAKIEKGKRDGEKFVNTNFFHIYYDRLHFPYQIDMTRDDEEKGENGQRYTLCLWESNAKPHLYWFTVKFLKKKGDSQPKYLRPSPCSGKWGHEKDLFEAFFKLKTGICWEDRVLLMGTTSPSLFQYTPPRGGKSVGRRLRHSYEYCLEINAQLRGLPWPPVEEKEDEKPRDSGDAADVSPTSEDTMDNEVGSVSDNDSTQGSDGDDDIGDADDSVSSPPDDDISEEEPQPDEDVVEKEPRTGNGCPDSMESHTGTSPSPSPVEDCEGSHELSNSEESHTMPVVSQQSTETQTNESGTLDQEQGPHEVALPDQEQTSGTSLLQIDSERLNYAVQRALRIPAMAA